jgi:molecular chaperone HscB
LAGPSGAPAIFFDPLAQRGIWQESAVKVRQNLADEVYYFGLLARIVITAMPDLPTMSTSSSAATAPIRCANCSTETGGAHFCPACGAIQPLPAAVDYFAFFGLPPKLSLDLPDLEQRFHSLSWKLHPDNFMRASEAEKELSLDRSSQLNDAYRTLRDPVARVAYLLELFGMRKEGQKKQQAPPELLEEVFELNESLDSLRDARASGESKAEVTELREVLEVARKKFDALLADTDQELARVATDWDRVLDSPDHGNDNAAKTKLMEQMNNILNRRSYIRNLVASTQKELSENS